MAAIFYGIGFLFLINIRRTGYGLRPNPATAHTPKTLCGIIKDRKHHWKIYQKLVLLEKILDL